MTHVHAVPVRNISSAAASKGISIYPSHTCDDLYILIRTLGVRLGTTITKLRKLVTGLVELDQYKYTLNTYREPLLEVGDSL